MYSPRLRVINMFHVTRPTGCHPTFNYRLAVIDDMLNSGILKYISVFSSSFKKDTSHQINRRVHAF